MVANNPDGPIILPDEYSDNTFGITSINNDDEDDNRDGNDLDFSE